ncbi:MAG: type II toxin-antitoxin system RelE/ParE family toxin [Ignavibacteria bacterium]|jgi:plasmid stabilization system protein ParE|nr:type II toxin-antitoxin system RelE/ParE family toxin [Ignavibacteria bacterium]
MTLSWSEAADEQFYSTLKYWDNRNLSTLYSQKLVERTNSTLVLLMFEPCIGRPTIYGDIRTILVDGKYNIYYEYDEELDEIHILSFWDGRQNPEKLTELFENN